MHTDKILQKHIEMHREQIAAHGAEHLARALVRNASLGSLNIGRNSIGLPAFPEPQGCSDAPATACHA